MVNQIPKTLFKLEPIADNKVYFPKYVRSYLDGYTSCLKKIHCNNDVIETVLMGMFYGAQTQTMMPKVKSTSHPRNGTYSSNVLCKRRRYNSLEK